MKDKSECNSNKIRIQKEKKDYILNLQIVPGDLLLGRKGIIYDCRGSSGEEGRDIDTPLARPNL